MNRPHANLIADLAQDLDPVRVLKTRDGMLLTAGAALASILAVALIDGLWKGPLTGDASMHFYLANAMLAVFGVACAASVVQMASPGVGNRYSGAYWSLAMLAVLPVVALLTLFTQGVAGEVLADPYGVECALHGSAAASITALALTAWLRRGAPVDPARAGLLTGLAAGALGSAAYGLSCPVDTMGHVAFWHILPVGIAGLVGRIVLPRILRW